MIEFTIAGTTYQAEEGMTWVEWVASEYNTYGWYITQDSNYVANSSPTTATLLYNGTDVSPSSTIIADAYYTISK